MEGNKTGVGESDMKRKKTGETDTEKKDAKHSSALCNVMYSCGSDRVLYDDPNDPE